MRTNRRIMIVLIITLGVLSFAVILLTTGVPHKAVTESETGNSGAGYTVSEYDGRIAVFESGGKTPLYVLESPVVTDLPFEDRKKLAQGINAKDSGELSQILQDYDN